MERAMPAQGLLHRITTAYLGPDEGDLDDLEMAGVRFVPCQMATIRGQAGRPRAIHHIGLLQVCWDYFF